MNNSLAGLGGMITLEQHNEQRRLFAESLRMMNRAGVACDRCKTEMIYSGKTSIGDDPKHVECPNCHHRGLKL